MKVLKAMFSDGNVFLQISGLSFLQINRFDDTITLKDVYPLQGLKLYYFFDYGASWIFEIRKSRKKAKIIPEIEYPRIISDNKIKLRQYDDEIWD